MNRIREVRKAKKLSQTELAEMLHEGLRQIHLGHRKHLPVLWPVHRLNRYNL